MIDIDIAKTIVTSIFLYNTLLQTNTNRDGSLIFECQHGPVECDANIYHACTIEAIQDQKLLLDMISCMISNNYRPKEALISCAKENHVDYEGNHDLMND